MEQAAAIARQRRTQQKATLATQKVAAKSNLKQRLSEFLSAVENEKHKKSNFCTLYVL